LYDVNQVLTVFIGVALAAVVAGVAWRLDALRGGGALAAAGIGAIAVAAGWSWAFILAGYFVGSTLLSRARSSEKARRSEGRVEKEGARDATQVLANGAVFALAAAAAAAAGVTRDHVWMAVATGALGASAADTWATEIGLLSNTTPRSVLGWKQVPPGTSGGVTALGFAGGVAGAAFVAALAWVARWPSGAVLAAVAGGVVGCVADSIIGAAFQARRWCGSCSMATERSVHRCGAPTTITGGWGWLNNDGVNLAATISGAISGAMLAGFLQA
jgi:uncharacterized protein (TIGR00297 family)